MRILIVSVVLVSFICDGYSAPTLSDLQSYDYAQYKFASGVYSNLIKKNNAELEVDYNIWSDDPTPTKTITFDEISKPTLRKICEDFDLDIFIRKEGVLVKCDRQLPKEIEVAEEFITNNDVSNSDERIKRDVDELEGSGSDGLDAENTNPDAAQNNDTQQETNNKESSNNENNTEQDANSEKNLDTLTNNEDSEAKQETEVDDKDVVDNPVEPEANTDNSTSENNENENGENIIVKNPDATDEEDTQGLVMSENNDTDAPAEQNEIDTDITTKTPLIEKENVIEDAAIESNDKGEVNEETSDNLQNNDANETDISQQNGNSPTNIDSVDTAALDNIDVSIKDKNDDKAENEPVQSKGVNNDANDSNIPQENGNNSIDTPALDNIDLSIKDKEGDKAEDEPVHSKGAKKGRKLPLGTEAGNTKEDTPQINSADGIARSIPENISPKKPNEVSKEEKSNINTSNQNIDLEEPKSGETIKAEKDSSILIFLFVAVVVVGAAAFGYNFIKKRRRNTADTARAAESATNKRNLERKIQTEAKEHEMKPLMTKKQENVEPVENSPNGNIQKNGVENKTDTIEKPKEVNITEKNLEENKEETTRGVNTVETKEEK